MYFEHVGVTLFGSGVAGIYFVSKVPDRRASKVHYEFVCPSMTGKPVRAQCLNNVDTIALERMAKCTAGRIDGTLDK